MRRLTGICYLSQLCILLSMSALTSIANAAGYDIVIKSGDQHKLTTSPETSVHIQNGRVLKVKDHGMQISIIGKKQGVSDLKVGLKKYSVLVLTHENYITYSMLNEACKKMLGPQPDYHKGKIYLSGNLYRFQDWLSISQQFRNSQNKYLINAKIDADVKEDFKKKLNQILKINHLPIGKFRFSPTVELIYSKAEKQFKSQLLKTLSPLGVDLKFADSNIGLKPMVKVKIIVAEVSKKASEVLGVSWSDSIEGSVKEKVQISPVEFNIHLLEAKGLSKVLASPTLLSRSGSDAEFLAGGEIPIKTRSIGSTNVVWKPYGVKLKINPKADYTGNMSIKINTEISSLDHSNADSDLPSLKVHRLNSHVDLKDSQTIILSGLLKQDQHQGKSAISLLQSLPVIGELFKSKGYLNFKTELVVFITPSLVDEADKYVTPENHFPSEWKSQL